MAASFIAAATNAITSTSITVDLSGLTILSNDVLIAVLHHGDSGTITNSAGASFTSKFQEENPAQDTSQHAFFERVANGTETTVSFSIASSNRFACHVLQFRGIDVSSGLASIWDVPPSNTSRNWEDVVTTLATPTPLTTTATDTIGIGYGFDDSDGVTFSGWTSGYTNEVEHGSGQALAGVTQVYSTSGSKTAMNTTISATGDLVVHHFALKAAPGPVITDVDGDETWDDGATGLVITGSNFV